MIIPVIGQKYKSLNFVNASSQYLSMSDSNFGAYTRSKFSVAFWVKFTSLSGGQVGLYCHCTSGDVGAFKISIQGNQLEVETYHDVTSSLVNRFTSTSTFTTGTWYHIIVHIDPTNATSTSRIKVWVNGSAETASGYTATNATDVYDTANPVYIGTFGGSGILDGKIFQPAFFDNTLVAAASLLNSGHPIYDITGVTGLYSLITGTNNTVVNDYVLSTDWTNNNVVTLSTNIPT